LIANDLGVLYPPGVIADCSPRAVDEKLHVAEIQRGLRVVGIMAVIGQTNREIVTMETRYRARKTITFKRREGGGSPK